MAFREELSAIKANVVLNNGVSTTGKVLVKNISVGTLDPAAWDLQKFGAIAQALVPLFDKSVYEYSDVKTYRVLDN